MNGELQQINVVAAPGGNEPRLSGAARKRIRAEGHKRLVAPAPLFWRAKPGQQAGEPEVQELVYDESKSKKHAEDRLRDKLEKMSAAQLIRRDTRALRKVRELTCVLRMLSSAKLIENTTRLIDFYKGKSSMIRDILARRDGSAYPGHFNPDGN